MNKTLIPLIAAYLIAFLPSARADLTLSMADKTVTAGQASFIDVLVSSSGTDTFQNFFLDFTSTTDGFFLESDADQDQLTATMPDYIFLNNSLAKELDLPIDVVIPFDPLFGVEVLNTFDETFDELDQTVTSTDTFLLARINFIAPTAGTFDIELDLLTSGFFDFDNAESAIIDEVNSTLTATITANAGSAVPEPSSFAFLLLSGVGCLGRRRRRL
ncbi:MAG: PEP-CTERM sorting domain-containing protein [Planctomycetaceae bacterium]